MTNWAVPFYANPDHEHCVQAGIKSVLKYFLPDTDYSWPELELLSGFVKNKGTWATKSLISLYELGFRVVEVSTFDYPTFSKQGELYLIKRYGPEQGKYAINNSDLPQEMALSAKIDELNVHQHRVPDINDIKELLDGEYVPCVTLNSRLLNKKDGFAGHFVVIIGYDDDGLTIHDPGPEPQKSRKVDYALFNQAWAIPTNETKLLYAFKK